jgi:hypothetical protein
MRGAVRIGDARSIPRTASGVFISDPPYNQAYHYASYTDALPDAEYSRLLADVFRGRPAVVMHYPEEMINIVGPALGAVSDVMAWVYPSNQGKQHRLVGWWNCKPDWRKTPQPYKNPTDRRVAALIAAGKQARGYDWVHENHVKNVSKVGHPCPIPLAIAERLVLASTEPGQLVIDPFCGSGTILVAAKKHGRDYFGTDMDPAYVALAEKRLAEV